MRQQVDANHFHRMVATDDGEHADVSLVAHLAASTKMVEHGVERGPQLANKNQIAAPEEVDPEVAEENLVGGLGEHHAQ